VGGRHGGKVSSIPAPEHGRTANVAHCLLVGRRSRVASRYRAARGRPGGHGIGAGRGPQGG
jgi:hypothetical protein